MKTATAIILMWENEWPDKPPMWEYSEARLRLITAVHNAMEAQHRETWAKAMVAAKAIADGNYDRPVAEPYAKDGRPHKGDKCPHDCYTWDACDACISDAINTLSCPPLTPTESDPT